MRLVREGTGGGLIRTVSLPTILVAHRHSMVASSTSPVRVTHVVHEFEGGGLETLVAAMARGMDPRRVSTSVISMSGSIGRLGAELESQLRDMVAIKPFPLVSLVAPVGLARAIRRTNAEVVHI